MESSSLKLLLLLFLINLCASDYRASASIFTENIFDQLKNNKDLSAPCMAQISNLDPETLFKMIDSSTKLPSGIMAGAYFDLGNYDECLDIDVTSAVGPVRGKYCLGTIPFSEISTDSMKQPVRNDMNFTGGFTTRMMGTTSGSIGFHFSICVPHRCSAKEISIISEFSENFCYSKNDKVEYSAGFYVTMAITVVFLLIVIESTIYDFILQRQANKPRHEILISFSVISNGQKLFSSSANPDQLLCLNGIKAISMMWVILGHTYFLAAFTPSINMQELLKFQEKAENMFIMNATVSVDTFFVIGGLVTVYTFLKSMDRGVKFNIFLFYLHRYLRLTPALGIVILFHLYVLNYIGSGPLWGTIDGDLVKACQTGWWSALLYVENYHLVFCVPQTWYLSVDMQLFILSPLFLLPMVRWPKYTLAALFCTAISGIVIPFVVGYVNDLNPMFGMGGQDSMAFMNRYYSQTYTRFGPYVIGMILGYYIYNFKKSGRKVNLDLTTVIMLWILGIGSLLACLYAPYENANTTLSNAFMIGFQRNSWAISLCLVIYLCVTGHGGVIDSFLSLPVFQLLAKLSYSMYLVHYCIINIKSSSSKAPTYFSHIEMMMQFWGYFMFTLVISVVLCLTFESPIIIIERTIFGRGNVEKKSNPKPSPSPRPSISHSTSSSINLEHKVQI